MKTIKYILSIISMALLCSSCLESNLKELDVFKGSDITSTFVYYRYIDESYTHVLSGANAVKQVTLTVSNAIDNENGTCDITVTIPSNFPASERANISAGQLVVAVSISTAAIISPIGDSPKLGTPADWSVPHKYMIEAADKSRKEWTISVNLVQ
ncbi:MAG: hypothetical protein IKZ71_00330 [Bacteroidales bacterium]|jgi:hypothetical protein|nr:hypothetical protein [Bacteroidales bacterium]